MRGRLPGSLPDRGTDCGPQQDCSIYRDLIDGTVGEICGAVSRDLFRIVVPTVDPSRTAVPAGIASLIPLPGLRE